MKLLPRRAKTDCFMRSKSNDNKNGAKTKKARRWQNNLYLFTVIKCFATHLEEIFKQTLQTYFIGKQPSKRCR